MIEIFKSVLVKLVGAEWVESCGEEDFESFVEWAGKTHVYLPIENRSGDAFRGFMKACELKNRQILDLENSLRLARSHSEVMEHKATLANSLLRAKVAELINLQANFHNSLNVLLFYANPKNWYCYHGKGDGPDNAIRHDCEEWVAGARARKFLISVRTSTPQTNDVEKKDGP